MASPFSVAAQVIQAVFDQEFQSEGFTMVRDKLHEALGRSRVDVGIAPIEDIVDPSNSIVSHTIVEVRFYDLWSPEVSPEVMVDPTRIAEFAERLRSALKRTSATDPGHELVWYFNVIRTTYPDDPIGNKTRFHMTIRCYGTNSSLVETGA